MHPAYRRALLCGAIPLVAGLATYFVWRVTRADWLVGLGFLIIFAGFWSVVLGLMALGRYLWLSFRTTGVRHGRTWLAALAAGALLLANFPVARAIMLVALNDLTRYTVQVRNSTRLPLNDAELLIASSGYRVGLGRIPAGREVSESLQIRGEGALEFRASSGGETIDIVVDDYATSGLSGHYLVVVRPDGTVAVQKMSR